MLLYADNIVFEVCKIRIYLYYARSTQSTQHFRHSVDSGIRQFQFDVKIFTASNVIQTIRDKDHFELHSTRRKHYTQTRRLKRPFH